MKKLLLLLLCMPLISIGQSVKLTPCECVKYITAEMKLQGFKDSKELDNSDIKNLELLEEKYKGCEQFRGLFIDKHNDIILFKEEFTDCILDDEEFSDFCKCTYLIMPSLLEGLSIGFSDKIDKTIKEKREIFWENKMSCCNPTIQQYGKLDEWGEDLVEDAEECEKKLLNEVLGYTTQSNKKETNKSHSNNTKKVSLYGEINDPDGYTNVREDKSSKSDILFKVYKNKRFKIIDNSGNWWLIEYNGNQGYMYKDRIDVIE